MSVNILPLFKKKKELYLKNDEVQIYLIYTYDRRKLRVSTGVTVKIKDWDEEWINKRKPNPILKSDPNNQVKNILIKQKYNELIRVIDEIKINKQIPIIELVKSKLKGIEKVDRKKTFENIDFLVILREYKSYIDNEVTLRKGYKNSINSSISKIEEFTNIYQNQIKYTLLITDIDDDYQKSFLKHFSKKGDQPSTIRKNLKTLVSLINWSVKKEYTTQKISLIQFNHDFDKDVLYLTRDEVLQLYNFKEFDFENPDHKKYTTEYFYDKLKNGKTIRYTNFEVYKDILVFGCGVGCRFGDLVSLKLDNYQFSEDRTEGYIVFRMEKSRLGKQVKVPINRLTFEIWKKYSKNKTRTDYIFPKSMGGNLVSNQKMNKQIKEIGKIVKLERLVSNPKFDIEGKVVKNSDTREPIHQLLTTHIMRRTFIREGIENKIPTHIMMSMSGHSTEKVFRRYFSTTTTELDNEGKKMFSLKLSESNKEKNNSEIQTPTTIEQELLMLKEYFNKGLIPIEIYNSKVDEVLKKLKL